VTTAAAAASLAFTAGCIGCLVHLHLAPTGYSPVRNAVGEYGIGAYGAWYRGQVRCAAGAAVFLAAALRHPRRVVVLLLVLAVARLGIGFFPVVHPSHVWFALVAFLSALGWAMAACALGTSFALRTSLRPYLGVIGRGFYVSMLAWFVLVDVRLL
jgi:hypothetical membrane protein